MTSSNVSNLLAQMSTAVNTLDSVSKSKNVEFGGDSFEKALQGLANFSVDTKSSPVQVKSVETTDAKAVVKNEKSDIKSESKQIKADEPEGKDFEEIKEKVNEFGEKVKEVIKDELGVSDEDIEKAMEVLGLTVVDLIDPQNLAKLVLEVSDLTESVSLILSDSFKNIFDEFTKLANQLLDEIGISPVEIQELSVTFNVEQPVGVEFEQVVAEIANTSEGVADGYQSVATEEKMPEVNSQNSTVISEDSEAKDASNSITDEQVVQLKEATSDKETQSGFSSDSNSSRAQHSDELIGSRDESGVIMQTESKFEMQFSPETESVSLPTGENVSVREIIDQIVEQTKVLVSEEQTTMEMTLNPEGLGKIYMEVTQKGDEITAKLFAENEVVKEALESQMATLRTDMNSTSQKVTSIEVAVGAHEFERNLEEDARGQQQSQEQAENYRPKHRTINLNNLDELQGLMTEEEQLVAQIMRENGNTLDYMA